AKLLFDDHIRCMDGIRDSRRGRTAVRELKHSALCAVLRLRPSLAGGRGTPIDRLQRVNPFTVASACAPGSVRKRNVHTNGRGK
ncbi:hypothetical protein PFISCL1PPCAC_2274, partial [Pristionchus fissidentatus]